MRIVSFFLCLLAVACNEPSRNQSPHSPSPENHVGEVAPEASEPASEPAAEPNDPCPQLRAETHAILQEPAAACASDEDCECYPAFIDCGGVMDSATAERLVEVDVRRRAAGCDYIDIHGNGFNCAPWECSPRCQAGVCLR